MPAQKQASHRAPWGLYALLAFLILAPCLGRGYILTLDMVFTPHLRMPTSVSSSYLFRVLLHALNYILPSDIIEKIILFAIFVLSGAGAHRLMAHGMGKKLSTAQQLGCYFAGTLYMINPFTYDRLMAGQYGVLLGYALLPWFLYSLLSFLRKPAPRTATILTLWAIATSIVSIHAIGFMAILASIAAGIEAWRRCTDKVWLGNFWKFGLASLAIFLIASSYWLVPLALGHGSTATEINSFTTADQAAFATLGGSAIGRLGNVLLLQGFWAEGPDLYNLPQDSMPYWYLLTGIVWLLVIVGIMSFWKQRRRSVLALYAGSALVAIILAISTLNSWLAAHVPLFAGYREPEKFVTMVCVSFAVFGGQGVASVLSYWRRIGWQLFAATSVVLLAVPLLWTSVMFWGANNQLTPVQYPASWFAVNKQLDADKSSFQTLFLPWHQYMSFDFEGRIIANPAPQFFDKPVIISNNPQFNGIPPTPNKQDSSIGSILANAGSQSDLAAKLAPYHIKYIILDNDDDYAKYSYLSHQSGLQLVYKNATVELYRNNTFGGK